MRKYLLIVLPLLFLSIGVSQNRVKVNNLVQYGDKWFKENEDRPFNGIVFDLSKETGNKILGYKMVDGLKNGLYQEWYPDGKPKSKGKYLNHTQVGDWTYWHENGQKKSEGNYKTGKRDGSYTEWYKNGQINVEKTYKDGKLNGIVRLFSEEGRITDQFLFKDGISLKANSSLLMLSGDTIHFLTLNNFNLKLRPSKIKPDIYYKITELYEIC